MNRDGRRRAQRVYRLLVRLYPAAHRRAFGEQMVQMFGDHYRDAIEGRGDSRLRFWLAALADLGASLLTEHAAEASERRRRTVTAMRRLRRPDRRAEAGVTAEARKRRVRVARRLRYRRRLARPGRVLIRIRQHRLVYRGRIAELVAFAALTGVLLGIGTATGHPGIGGLLAGLSATAWLARSLRLIRPIPAGPQGDGPTPPGGASMREPRRPLPMSPAGSAARPRPDPDEPGEAVALI